MGATQTLTFPPHPSAGGGGAALLALGLVLLTILLSLAYRRYVLRPRRILRRLQAQGVPGYPFLPYLGQLPDIIKSYAARDSDPALAASTSGIEFWIAGTKRFGPVWTFAMGGATSVVVADPDVVRQIYVAQSEKTEKTGFVKAGLALIGSGLVVSDGDLWQRHRRLINPAFGMREVKRLFPIMGRCASKALQRWGEQTPSTASSGGRTSSADADAGSAAAGSIKPAPLLMDVELGALTMDVILRAAFGTHLDRLLEESDLGELQDALTRYFTLAMLGQQLASIVPLYSSLPTPLNRGKWRMRQVVMDAVHHVVEQRMEELAAPPSGEREAMGIPSRAPSAEGPGRGEAGLAPGDPSSKPTSSETESKETMPPSAEGIPPKSSAQEETDLLTLMLKATHLPRNVDGTNGFSGLGSDGKLGSVLPGAVPNGASEDDQQYRKGEKGHVVAGAPMSMDEVIAECITFFAAGSETTSNLLTWTMLLLSQHPEWQEKAREEVMEVCGRRGGEWSPSFEELNELKVVAAVLNETLRLLPPAPLVSRHCNEDIRVSPNLVIPKGCDVYVMIEAIHKNKEFWGPDAEEFHPERFLEGVGKAALRPGVFLPFSIGPRNCIGQNFAMVEAKVLLGAILAKFSWKVAESYAHHPEALLTLKAKHGLPVYLTPLSP